MLIRAMEEGDIYEVLSVAESAFFGEKLYLWTVPNNDERSAFIRAFFGFRLKWGWGKNVMEVAVDDTKKIVGAAIWAPPAKDEQKDIPKDFEKIFLNFNNDVRERTYKFIATVMEAENFFAKPYWTLSPIFIRRDMQGKGIASLLMKKRLKILDSKKQPCALVTQEENNIPIYERYGFKVGVKLPIDAEIISYGMIRG